MALSTAALCAIAAAIDTAKTIETDGFARQLLTGFTREIVILDRVRGSSVSPVRASPRRAGGAGRF